MTPDEAARDELIEAMARAVASVEYLDRPPAHTHRRMARAAIAILRPALRAEVLEEAARVCERRYMGDNNREDMEAKRCAAAIRALVKEPT